MSTPNTQDDVRAAFAAATETTETSGDADTQTDSAPAVDSAGDTGSVAAGSDAGGEGRDSGEPKTVSRTRGPDGKFVGKAEATPAAIKPTATETKAPVAAAATQTPAPVAATQTAVKAPQSWRADVREKFAALPAEVQAEVLRRETEVAQTLQAIAPAKRLQQALAPFEADAKAQGADLTAMLPGIMQTVTSLAKGNEKQRAQIFAKMISGYGVSVDSLAEALNGAQTSGNTSVPNPDAIAQQVQQRVMEQFQAQRSQALQQQALAEAETFAAQAEFIDDVRMTMAAIIESAQGQRPVTLQEAYDQACWATPSVRAVIQQREAAKAAQAQQQNVAKAKGAAVSVRSAPAVSPIQRDEGGSTMDDVRATIAALSGGGTR